jgi:hypothetical protein
MYRRNRGRENGHKNGRKKRECRRPLMQQNRMHLTARFRTVNDTENASHCGIRGTENGPKDSNVSLPKSRVERAVHFLLADNALTATLDRGKGQLGIHQYLLTQVCSATLKCCPRPQILHFFPFALCTVSGTFTFGIHQISVCVHLPQFGFSPFSK